MIWMIKSTVNKIKLLAEQNPEFKQTMQKLFGNSVSNSSHFYDDKRITNIEKYLGLDYNTDSKPSIIDYSYIQEANIREQLISDNREMLRFRHGTRFHQILFDEFCRYAQLQAEMLINYYYYHKDSTIPNAIAHIKSYNTTAKIDTNTNSLAAISFNTKLWAFCNEFKLRKAQETFYFVREVRNRQSHRRPEPEFSFFDYQKKLIDLGIKLRSDGSFDYFKTKENTSAFNIYESQVKNKPKFKLYLYHSWFNKKPYDEIISRLKEISETINRNI